MALQKQAIPVNFSQGLDQKTDPKQIALGRFLSLQNSVFTKAGLLQKRNGYKELSDLLYLDATYLTTFNGNLTAIGSHLQAYAAGSNKWVAKGSITPVSLDTLPVVRSNTNQTYADTAIASNGYACTVFTDQIPSGGSNSPSYKYVVYDYTTGQNIIAPTVIPVSSGAVTGNVRVFTLGNYFILVFNNLISATNHLQYIAINIVTPTIVTSNTDLSALYSPSSAMAFDGVVANDTLYLAFAGSSTTVKLTYLTKTLVQGSTVSFATQACTHMSVCADTTQSTPVIYAAYYDSNSTNGHALAVNQNLQTVHSPVQIITGETANNITSVAQNSLLTFFYQITNAYGYDSGIRTDYIKKNTMTQSGTVGSATVMVRSIGLASKAFLIDQTPYMLGVYQSNYQPTYFLINSSGQVISKLAYSNGGGYYSAGLPGVASVDSLNVKISYLFKDLVQAVNKTQGAANSAGIYAQTGINLVSFDFSTNNIQASELGKNLNINGGFLWAYDGYLPVEQNFHLWPDYVEVSTSGSGGSLTAQQYFYQVTYEWSDNQGNLFRSAPSVPVSVTTTGTTSSNTIHVPTLRLTYKTANPVKIVVYRWSAGQQTYYQVTSVLVPTLNDTTVDSIDIVDTLADTSIVGNNILYTTGGVIEDTGAPSFSALALFKSRLFGIDAEDKNLLWYSKQVIEGTPVEMSDLLTLFVAPTLGADGSSGPNRCLFPLDDKLIIFKDNALYYITGNGPDNTGANNDFSDPIFITATVGSNNPNSIVFIPNGIMFQSNKGIWLLGRDLTTQYIGAPVEDLTTGATVLSAVSVPGTNQVRFTLDSGVTLMYDYYYNQWGTFVGIPGESSTIYGGFHTFINSYGQVFQENPGSYLDGATPVLMKFTTGWINLAGLQGYERAYFFYLLGTYYSPHKLTVDIAYDYNASPTQRSIITPDNYAGTYGSASIYGGDPYYGGKPNDEQWRVFLAQQKCQAFQITVSEVFDASYGTVAGQGLNLSGLDIVVGIKSGYPRIRAARSVG